MIGPTANHPTPGNPHPTPDKALDRAVMLVRCWMFAAGYFSAARMRLRRAACFVALWFFAGFALGGEPAFGLFEDHGDVGDVRKAGSLEYDPARETYLIAGGGENMWFTNDAFHFVWKRMSGDLTLAANVRWLGTNGNPHRKACLVIRQTLDADSPYADVAVHGDGLTSLQYRETKSGLTREIQASVSAPDRVRLEKRGDYVSMSVAYAGGPLRSAGGSFRIEVKPPFYIGLGVCAHDNNAIERAVFSNVEIVSLPASGGVATNVQSTLEFISIASKDRRIVYHTSNH